MNFFQRQGEARKNTTFLLVCFALAVAMVIAMVYSFVALLSMDSKSMHGQFYNGTLLQWVSISTLAIIGTGWLIKAGQLRAGGRAVANMFSARLISGATSNLSEQRLMNVVEEMSIAASIPMPQVYILDKEPGINAFVAG